MYFIVIAIIIVQVPISYHEEYGVVCMLWNGQNICEYKLC